jgi:tRNA(Ile)-lysidine synthase
LEAGAVFRHPKEEDYIIIHKDGSRKKVKDYLADEKVPREERDRVWVLASGNGVFWVVGKRISEDAKVTAGDRKALSIDLKPLNDGE